MIPSINIYLRFALIAVAIIGGTLLSIFSGFWYGFPFIFVGLILLAGYFIFGTVISASKLIQTQDFEAADKRLDLTFFPKLLYVTNRATYFILKGSIAAYKKDNSKAESFFNEALELNLPTDNERAMVLLQLININANKGNWNLAKKQYQELKKLKVSEPQLRDQVLMVEKAINQSGQIKAQQRMVGRGGRSSLYRGGGKRKRPKNR